MKIYIFTLLYFVTITTTALFAQNIKPKYTTKIQLDAAQSLNYDDLFSDYDLIILEEKENSLIDYVGKIIPQEDKVVILDRRDGQGNIKIFNEAGKLQEKITFPFDGPYSILKIADINICNNSIVVFDNVRRKIITLDDAYKKNTEYRLSQVYSNFSCGDKYYAFFSGITAQFDNEYYLDYYNKELEYSKSILPVNNILNNPSFLLEEQNFYQINKSSNIFFHSLENKIYLIDESGIQKKIIIDLDQWIPKSQISQFKSMDISEWVDFSNKREYINQFLNVLHFKNQIFFTVDIFDNRYWLFHDLKTRNTKIFKLPNSLTAQRVLSSPMSVFDSTFYFVIDQENFRNNYKSITNNSSTITNITKLLQSFPPTEQPIILKAKLRDINY